MVPDIRAAYNKSFTADKYTEFLADLDSMFNYHIPFRVAESPVFVDKAFTNQLLAAADEIVDFIVQPGFKALTDPSIPPHLNVPRETDHSHFLALDFAVCKDENGEYIPQLIELQGFPSLFGWEETLAAYYRKHFAVPANYQPYFTADRAEYYRQLAGIITGDCDPENVVLLEIDPMKQNTAIDFMITAHLTHIKVMHIGDVMRRGYNLFYKNDNGVDVPIKCIYNRIIFDEFEQRTDLFGQCAYNLVEEVDATWAGHPNWFFRISKYIMPLLRSRYVPACTLLKDYHGQYPSDLENYVLKPLFSFSGGGVVFNCTLADIEAVSVLEHHMWMLQRKVQYEACVKTTDEGYAKPELRLLYFWPDGASRPHPVLNLARLSRGEMIGVKYNKDKTWVGGSVALFER